MYIEQLKVKEQQIQRLGIQVARLQCITRKELVIDELSYLLRYWVLFIRGPIPQERIPGYYLGEMLSAFIMNVVIWAKHIKTCKNQFSEGINNTSNQQQQILEALRLKGYKSKGLCPSWAYLSPSRFSICIIHYLYTKKTFICSQCKQPWIKYNLCGSICILIICEKDILKDLEKQSSVHDIIHIMFNSH